MKIKLSLLAVLQLSALCCFSQNVGIGTTEPMNKLQAQGSLLVTTPTTATSTAPTPAQTKIMPGLGTQTFLLSTDSTGRLYDSGGPGGNYGIDHDGKVTIALAFNIAIEVTAETMDLSIGDSLIIKESSTGLTLLAVGNGYSTTGKWIFNSSSLYINFKSNTDFNTGAGFSLLFRRLYSNAATVPGVNGYTGSSFLFDVRNGLVRSGHLNNAAMGGYSSAFGYSATASGLYSTASGFFTNATGQASVAMGNGTEAAGSSSVALGLNTTSVGSASVAMGGQTIAAGDYSTAMGNLTGARGHYSTAMGRQTTANGLHSTAMGILTNASGENSTAMGKYTDATGYAATAIGDSSLASGTISFASGFRTTASGDFSTAMGYNAIASGDRSTAIGNYVSTNNQGGSFIIGDNSTAIGMVSPVPNFFAARFAGGYRLFSNASYTTGTTLFAGDNAWTTASDVRTKENFAEVNGEDFLKKISGFHLTSWNYKNQNPATFRHYGPMAQDFYAAFGNDKYGTIGNDTTINSSDFAGVSFIAIQALEKRTAGYKKEIAELKAMLLQLRKEMDELKMKNAVSPKTL
jgi:Head domain of trimeric autotransporter adhesin/Chaperone of endosialidase